MVEGVDAVAVFFEQRSNTLRVLHPEFREGAARLRKGAMDEDKQRSAVGRRGDLHHRTRMPLELDERVRLQRVHAGIHLRIDATDHRRCGEIGRLVGDEAGDDVDAPENDVSETTRRAAGAGACRQSTPLQSRRYDHRASGRASLCLVAAPALLRVRALGEHQIAGIFRVQHQSRSTGDVQDDSVFSRIRRDDDVALAAAALRADPDRVLEPAAQIVQLL